MQANAENIVLHFRCASEYGISIRSNAVSIIHFYILAKNE